MALEQHDTVRVIGVDPGPIPGLVVLDLDPMADGSGRWLRQAQAFQCTANAAGYLVEALLLEHGDGAIVQVETFVVSAKSGRLSNSRDSATTRDLVGAIRQAVEAHHRGPISGQTGAFIQRPAGQVKPWATDERLARARLLEPTKGMRHARDAARHALFAAVHDARLPDPLSKTFTTNGPIQKEYSR